MLDQEINIIIPTYDRPVELRRKLHHFHLSNCKIPIRVFDTSSTRVVKKNRSSVKYFSRTLDISYQKLSSKIGYIQKIYIAVAQLKTPYVVVHSDDDFLVIDAVKKCKFFLEQYPDYTNCTGITLSHQKYKDKELIFTSKNNVIDKKDPMERAIQNKELKRKKIVIYNVWRTSELLKVIEPLSLSPYKKYSEIMLGFLSAYAGRTKIINELYEIRTVDYTRNERRKSSLPQFGDAFEENFFDKNFYEDLKLFVKKSLFFINRQEILNDSKDLEIKIIELFLSSSLNKKKYAPVRNRHIVIFEKFFLFLKRSLKKILYLRHIFYPRKLIMIIGMLNLYGYNKTGLMLEYDKDFEFNIISLKRKNSRFFEPCSKIFNSLDKFRIN